MEPEEIMPGDELGDELPLDELDLKKKDLIDDDTVSLEDEIEEELDDDEPYDDVEEI